MRTALMGLAYLGALFRGNSILDCRTAFPQLLLKACSEPAETALDLREYQGAEHFAHEAERVGPTRTGSIHRVLGPSILGEVVGDQSIRGRIDL